MALDPKFKFFGPTIDQNGEPIGARIAGQSGPSSLTDPIAAPMAQVTAELGSLRNSLGWIDGLIVHRQTKKEAQRVISYAYLQLVEAQGQLLLAKITLGLDAAKKQLLIDSLRMSGVFDREIQALSTEFARVMFDSVLDASIAAAEAETRRMQQVDDAQRAGRMTEARAQMVRQMALEATDQTIAFTKDAAERIIRVHISKLELTLESFKQRAIGSGL
jgi:hypothetical protein